MELRGLILSIISPIKYELLFVFLFIVIPILFILMINSNKVEKLIFFLLNFFTSRAPTIENISLTKNHEFFKGTIYGHNLHIGDIFASLFIITMIAKKEFRKYFSIIPSGTFAVLLYGLSSAASLINASDITFDRSLYALSMHFRQFIFFYALANYFRIPMRKEYQLKSFFFIAVYSFFSGAQQRYILGLHRVAGDFPHPNAMVFYLIPTLVIFIALFFNLKESGYNKKVSAVAIAAVLMTCLMSISRGFVIHFGVAVSVVIVIDMIFKFNIKKPLIILVSILGMALLSMKAWDTWYNRFVHESNPVGTAQRKAYYFIGYEVLKENLAFGIGINQFGSNAYKMKIIDQVLEYDFIKNDKLAKGFINTFKTKVQRGIKNDVSLKYLNSGGTPESFYVLHFAETGLVGIFGTMFCQIFFILSAFRSLIYFRRRNIFYYSLSLGLIGAQFGIYAQSVMEFILRQEQSMYLQAILFALVSSITAVRKSKKFHHVDLSKKQNNKEGDLPPPIPKLNLDP